MRKFTKHFTQEKGGCMYMGVSLPTIPGSSVGDPGPSELRTPVMTSVSIRMCSIMVAVLLTTALAIPAPGSQKGQQALQPGQQFDPCEFEGRFWQFGEKFESYDKINRCKRVCFCQGNVNGVYCKPGCTR